MRETTQGTLFEERFLGRYAGSIMSDPTTALVELVANSWDAYATTVDIQWPSQDTGATFSILDNGIGMTPTEFELRWRTLDYDRIAHQGMEVSPPSDSEATKPRTAYGRNGRGRHAAFLFSNPYNVRIWKDGTEAIYKVSQGRINPIEINQISKRDDVAGHGCEVIGVHIVRPSITPDEARSVLSTRFLTDPEFKVSVDSVLVTFDDIPKDSHQEISVDIDKSNKVKILVIDSKKADRTTQQHGIAWWVNKRLVGKCHWSTSDHEKVLDGRSEEAKRYSFIVFADHLAPAVLPDWSNFIPTDQKWLETQEIVQGAVKDFINGVTKEKRAATKQQVRKTHAEQIMHIGFSGRDRWNSMLDELVDKCPSMNGDQINQVMTLLANLEQADSQYSLLEKLHRLDPSEIDTWDNIFKNWSLTTAKMALDEIETRLKLIEEIRYKSQDTDADEVHALQPLFERGLWVFGPQFESREFTSNKGMTTVIKKIFNKDERGSLSRPDFVITPDSSVGLYSRPSFDERYNENGVEVVVIVELKRAGVPIGSDEKNQVWKYVSELRSKGHITPTTKVHGFVLGDTFRENEGDIRKEGDNVAIQPMLYSTFTGQAEKRMLNLHQKLSDAPFLKETIARLEPSNESAQVDMILS